MTADPALLAELRLLRAMGEAGRTAAAAALRSARLGPAAQSDAALKLMIHELDSAIVDRGGGSIFATKARGTLSAEAERRIEAWARDTPRVHPDAGGPKPRPSIPPRQTSDRPGRLVGTLTGKLGGYASDLLRSSEGDGDEG
jgi:hypothetical protein